MPSEDVTITAEFAPDFVADTVWYNDNEKCIFGFDATYYFQKKGGIVAFLPTGGVPVFGGGTEYNEYPYYYKIEKTENGYEIIIPSVRWTSQTTTVNGKTYPKSAEQARLVIASKDATTAYYYKSSAPDSKFSVHKKTTE